MIISHKHKFIFIKTRKTAGTSIEILLEKICHSSDIVTRVSPKYSDSEIVGHRERNSNGMGGHTPACQVKELLGEHIWDSYFKFTIERNPWDKFVSMYWWRKHMHNLENSFIDFCFKSLDEDSSVFTCPSDYFLYSINGEVSVDSIIRFENLQAEFSNIMHRLNLPFDGTLPRAKSKIRKNKHKDYREYYNNELKDAVSSKFDREIALMQYEF